MTKFQYDYRILKISFQSYIFTFDTYETRNQCICTILWRAACLRIIEQLIAPDIKFNKFEQLHTDLLHVHRQPRKYFYIKISEILEIFKISNPDYLSQIVKIFLQNSVMSIVTFECEIYSEKIMSLSSWISYPLLANPGKFIQIFFANSVHGS